MKTEPFKALSTLSGLPKQTYICSHASPRVTSSRRRGGNHRTCATVATRTQPLPLKTAITVAVAAVPIPIAAVPTETTCKLYKLSFVVCCLSCIARKSACCARKSACCLSCCRAMSLLRLAMLSDRLRSSLLLPPVSRNHATKPVAVLPATAVARGLLISAFSELCAEAEGDRVVPEEALRAGSGSCPGLARERLPRKGPLTLRKASLCPTGRPLPMVVPMSESSAVGCLRASNPGLYLRQ